MAFVSIRPTVHIGRLGATESPFAAAVPDQYPARLQHCSIDEGFQLSRPQLPPREAVAEIVLLDQRDAYEARRIQAGDFVVIQDTEDGGTPAVRFRGRAYAPNVEDRERGRVEVRLTAHGLWQRLIGLPEVTVPAIEDANGKQAVDSVLDQAEWPTSFRDVPTPPNGADAEYQEWAFAGKPHAGVGLALAGINPRSKYWVDAVGRLRVRWLSRNLQQFRQREVRPDLRFNETERHLINQVLAPDVEVNRVATTRWESTTAVDLSDDADTVIYQAVVTFADSAEAAQWSYLLRQDNGTYFGNHPDVVANLTVSYIPGSAYSFNLALTARAKSGSYTTSINFFRLQDTVVSVAPGAGAPQVFNLGDVAAVEPRSFELPALAYADDVPETLASNYLTLWGRHFEYATFSVAMVNSDVVAKVRGLELWERMSVSDGNDTHFGFCVGRKIEYVHPRPVARIAMMEDFTEGGDISLPFRPPFEWVFNSIAALEMFFERSSQISNRGSWTEDTDGGSTPTDDTGPRPNNALPFCHTETSGGGRADHEDNGVVSATDAAFSFLQSREVVFRYCAQGDFAAGDGLLVQGRTVSTSIADDLIIAENAEFWRLNTSDPDDATAPYGSLGNTYSGPASIGAIALDASGDIIAATTHNNFGYRINLADVDDNTGIYGTLANGFAGNVTGMALEADGNILWYESRSGHQDRLHRRDTGTNVNQLLGNAPSQLDAVGLAIDPRNGNVWALNGNGDFYQLDPGNPSVAIGIHSSVLSLLTPVAFRNLAIDSNGDAWVIVIYQDGVTGRRLFRVNMDDLTESVGGYGDQGAVPSGLVGPGGSTIHARTITNYGNWTTIATLPASAYPASDASAGDTLTDVDGAQYAVVADGGWRDATVSIPNTYQEIRLRPALNAGGAATQQDIALRSIRSA